MSLYSNSCNLSRIIKEKLKEFAGLRKGSCKNRKKIVDKLFSGVYNAIVKNVFGV